MKQSIAQIASKAETLGMYVVASNAKGLLYIYDDGEYAIVTPDIVLRLSERRMELMVAELIGVIQDVKDLKRMEVRT